MYIGKLEILLLRNFFCLCIYRKEKNFYFYILSLNIVITYICYILYSIYILYTIYILIIHLLLFYKLF